MSLIIRQKRGALQLSINAIVVLILAITMLGLGLGFMKNMFGGTTKHFEQITEDMENQMIDSLKGGTDKIVLNAYKVSMSKASTKTIFFGIKNVDTSTKFFNISATCESKRQDGYIVDLPDDAQITFEFFDSVTIEGSFVEIMPLNIKTTTDAASTYSCSLDVDQEGTDYALKTFYIFIE